MVSGFLLSSTRKRDMTTTIIIGVLLGIVLLGVFGTIVPLILISFLTLGVGTGVVRGGRRLASRRHAGKRLKA
jgi:F0F1-type ATP synthase assembly protein I